MKVLLAGGTVVDGERKVVADVLVNDGRIVEVGAVVKTGGLTIDCSGRYIMPGFIDAHSHADAAVFEPDTQLALLRQGVTTVIAGQDGVSFAPGNGDYATEYFAAINGPHPTYRGGGVSTLLASYDHTTPVNVGYLVPQGTVRHEVLGNASRRPSSSELAQMQELVRAGLKDGALGLSTGLDYAPGYFADAGEIAALCEPVAEVGGLYVTHMRGYEAHAQQGISEVVQICRESTARGHISHFHGPAELLTDLLAQAASSGADLTFDAYPYRSAFTLLGMPLLPPDLLALGVSEAAVRLAEPTFRQGLIADWYPTVAARPDMGAGWADRARLARIASAKHQWAEGLSVSEAAARVGLDIPDWCYQVLADSRLEVSAVFALPPGRTEEELRALLRHPLQMAGSDGIYQGSHPHPRGWGTFSRYLGRYTREFADFSWPEIAARLASRPARRFGLADRGRVRPGFWADLAVVDPATVADTATYGDPRDLGIGVDDVLVNGIPVLTGGELTGALSGMGLRRG